MRKLLAIATLLAATSANAWYSPGAYENDPHCIDYGYMAQCDYDGDGYAETQMTDDSYSSGGFQFKENSRGQTYEYNPYDDEWSRTPWND